MFTREDKFRFGSLALTFAETSRARLPDVIFDLKESYVRAIREAASGDGSWSEVAKARAALEEATLASQLLDELLG